VEGFAFRRISAGIAQRQFVSGVLFVLDSGVSPTPIALFNGLFPPRGPEYPSERLALCGKREKLKN
jgi:hypothetical protein